VIHASAFADLLRQLVSTLGYQIVLSSHDGAEAAYIYRKCESLGIPVKLCELVPGGDSGMVGDR
jgi:hypothetical protein